MAAVADREKVGQLAAKALDHLSEDQECDCSPRLTSVLILAAIQHDGGNVVLYAASDPDDHFFRLGITREAYEVLEFVGNTGGADVLGDEDDLPDE